MTHRGRGRGADFLKIHTYFFFYGKSFCFTESEGKGGNDNEYKCKSVTDQGNGPATSKGPAIIPLNDDLVRLRLYASLALCDPNSDYHKLSNLPQCLILQTNIACT